LGRVGYVFDPIYLEHRTGNHPESPQRLIAILSLLRETALLDALVPVPAEPATIEDILRVHTPELIRKVRNLARTGGGRIDLDTTVSKRSYEAALYAAGGTIAATRAVLEGDLDAAYALVRPPGHHATPRQAMGFCLFNNLAIAAQWAREMMGVQRIAIIDYDVHHGNGIDDVFDMVPDVFYVSTHQYPLYPGTGDWRRPTHVRGGGHNLNIPLPAETGDEGYRRVFTYLIAPAVRRFRPDIILAAAGYDGHWADPLAWMLLSVNGYRIIADQIRDLARELCNGRLVIALEGGYHLQALAHSVATTFSSLLELPYPDPLGPSHEPEADIDLLIERIADWHLIEVKPPFV